MGRGWKSFQKLISGEDDYSVLESGPMTWLQGRHSYLPLAVSISQYIRVIL